jgi:hypothetical protein
MKCLFTWGVAGPGETDGLVREVAGRGCCRAVAGVCCAVCPREREDWGGLPVTPTDIAT